MTSTPQPEDTREYIALRYATDPIEAFNLFIKRNCPDQYAHFIDSDDNEAEYVRRAIDRHTNEQVRAALQDCITFRKGEAISTTTVAEKVAARLQSLTKEEDKV